MYFLIPCLQVMISNTLMLKNPASKFRARKVLCHNALLSFGKSRYYPGMHQFYTGRFYYARMHLLHSGRRYYPRIHHFHSVKSYYPRIHHFHSGKIYYHGMHHFHLEGTGTTTGWISVIHWDIKFLWLPQNLQ